MTTGALFHPRVKSARGFTLIEILIVILIISIVSGVALLTITNNQQKKIENFTNQLKRLIQLAETEAMLRPATLGLAFTPTSYQFFIYQIKQNDSNPSWQPLDDKLFGYHEIPSQIKFSLTVLNEEAVLNGKPSIIISESGDLTPFTLSIGKNRIIGLANGEIKYETINEQ